MNTMSKIPLGNAENLRRLGIDLAKSLLSPESSIDLWTVDWFDGPFPHQAPISASTTGEPSLRICSLTDNLFSLASKEAVACPSSCPPSSSDSPLTEPSLQLPTSFRGHRTCRNCGGCVCWASLLRQSPLQPATPSSAAKCPPPHRLKQGKS